MTTPQDTLCACGCQQICTRGKHWKQGHNSKVHPRVGRPRRPLLERLFEQVQQTETCWLWTGRMNKWGYGKMRPGGRQKRVSVHRLSYELHVGPIPDGLWVLHHCDTPACVRPDHLFLGDVQANSDDMIRKGRQWTQNPITFDRTRRSISRTLTQYFTDHPEARQRGENHGGAKLTADDVRYIRRTYVRRQITQKALAEQFGVTRTTITMILKRKNWAHLDS